MIITLALQILAIPGFLYAAKEPEHSDRLTEEKILSEIDGRIEKYRKGNATLRLLTLQGRPATDN